MIAICCASSRWLTHTSVPALQPLLVARHGLQIECRHDLFWKSRAFSSCHGGSRCRSIACFSWCCLVSWRDTRAKDGRHTCVTPFCFDTRLSSVCRPRCGRFWWHVWRRVMPHHRCHICKGHRCIDACAHRCLHLRSSFLDSCLLI